MKHFTLLGLLLASAILPVCGAEMEMIPVTPNAISFKVAPGAIEGKHEFQLPAVPLRKGSYERLFVKSCLQKTLKKLIISER